MADLVLASASPRRLYLLRQAGLDPVVRAVDVDEAIRPGEDPLVYVDRLAGEKAAAAGARDGEVVVAADTVVILDGEVLGKPAGVADAARMLRALAGRTHTVASGVAVATAGERAGCTVTTEVVFAPLTADMINAYVATGEPLDKAGAYGIQGRAAALVERIDGSYTNVVGLPLVETLDLLRAAGIGWPARP